jgi:hypothetical protein
MTIFSNVSARIYGAHFKVSANQLGPELVQPAEPEVRKILNLGAISIAAANKCQ